MVTFILHKNAISENFIVAQRRMGRKQILKSKFETFHKAAFIES